MKAAVYEPGRGVTIADVDLASPRAGEVEVIIAAAGVCHSDLHVLRGDWEVPTPVVLGHEGSGVVSRLGPGVTSLEVGDHVVLSWVPGCGECRFCRAGSPARCQVVAEVVAPGGVLLDGTSRLSAGGKSIHHYLGVSSYAERAVVPVSGAIKIRRDAPLDSAAIIGCAIATGVGAVENTAGVRAGSTVVVVGCGGVGLACIQGARLAGADKIVAVDIVAAKLEVARQCGATHVIDSSSTDGLRAILDILPDGADYAFDAIGAVSTTELVVECLGIGGTATVVGLPPANSRAQFDPLKLAEAEQRILGCNYGSIVPQRDIPRLVDLAMAGSIDLEILISGRRPLSEAAAALEDLASGVPLRQLLVDDGRPSERLGAL